MLSQYASYKDYVLDHLDEFKSVYDAPEEPFEQYVLELFTPWQNVILHDGVEVFQNYKSKFINVENNRRVTCFQPDNQEREREREREREYTCMVIHALEEAMLRTGILFQAACKRFSMT